MIYITGDTHAVFSRLNEDKFPIQNEMTKLYKDIVPLEFESVFE